MLSRLASTTLRQSSLARASVRSFATVKDAATADDALKYSGYSEIDFTVSGNYEAFYVRALL